MPRLEIGDAPRVSGDSVDEVRRGMITLSDNGEATVGKLAARKFGGIMPRLDYGTAVGRAIRLKCPRCGIGPLFRGLFSMHSRCSECGFVYERAPGYFLGSAYLNYGFMALTLTPMYMALHFGWGWSNQSLAIPLGLYCAIVPIVLFRYARAWWLAMDCMLDTTHFADGDARAEALAVRPSQPADTPPNLGQSSDQTG